MITDAHIDALVDRLIEKGAKLRRVAHAPWIEDVESRFGSGGNRCLTAACWPTVALLKVKTYLRIPIVALAVLATCECNAQIYRCEHGGKISYSDQTCDAGAKSTKKAYSPSTAS